MKVLTADGKIVEATPLNKSEVVAAEALSAGISMDNGIYIASREKESVITYILKNFKLELRNPPTAEVADEDDAIEVAPEVDRETDRYHSALVEPIAVPVAITV